MDMPAVIYGVAAQIIRELRARPLLFFALIHAVIFLGIFANLDHLVGSAILERRVALQMLDGQVPYRDFLSEYPPLALLSFLIPALLFPGPTAYGFAFAVEMLLLDLAVLLILASLATRLKMRLWHVLGIYTLSLLAVGLLVTGRYDLLPATLVLAALYAFISGRNKSAWALLALVTMAKAYPIIIAPIFVLYLLRQRRYGQLISGGAIFLGVVLVLTLPWVVLSPDGFWQFLSYHAERGLHSESSYGSLLLVGQVLGLTQLEGQLTFGSWNLVSPIADSLSKASVYISAGLLLVIYGLYARLVWRRSGPVAGMAAPDTGAAVLLLRYSLLAVLILLLSSKLFSAQFLIWLCPLLPLVSGQWRYALWLLFLAAAVLTQYIYPFHYIEFELASLELGSPYLVIMMAGRNFLLAVMAVFLIFPIRPSFLAAPQNE